MWAVRTILALVLVSGVACGGDDPTTTQGALDGQAESGEATGLVIEVEVEGDQVTAFVVESEGKSYRFLIDGEVDYGFDLHHLEEHRRAGDPVIVEFEQRSDGLYALAILDA